MKNKILLMAGSLIVLMVLIGLFVFFSENSANTIKIGASLPLSGDFAYKGADGLKGINLAVEEINVNGGINGKELVIIVEDNKGEPKTAVSSAQKLISVNKVPLILSAFTPLSSSIAPIAEENKVVLLYQSTDPTIAEQNDYAFKDYYSMSNAGYKLAEAVEKENISKVAFLYPIVEVSEYFKIGFKEKINSSGISIQYEGSVSASTNDFKTELLKIKNAEVEGIVFLLFPHQTNIMLKQIKEMGLANKRIFLLEALQEEINLNPISKQILEETNAITSWYDLNPNEELEKKFENKLSADIVYFYDDVLMLESVLEACDLKETLTGDCLREELLKIKEFNGIGGTISFNEKGVSNRPLQLLKNINGTWIKI